MAKNKVDEWTPIVLTSVINRWDEKGETVTGTFQGMRDGSLGTLIDVSVKPGSTETFSCPTMLRRAIVEGGINPGMQIKVVYQGEETTKAGRPLKMFEVFTKVTE
jgi:hypothetical protein